MRTTPPSPSPQGKKYRTICVDPPWEHPDSGPRTANGNHWDTAGAGTAGKRSVVPYDRMTLDAIKALPVGDLAEPDAHLYLWTTNRFVWSAPVIAEAWGFAPSTLLTWCKAPMGLGLGGAYTITTEFVLFARRGSLKPSRRWDSTWFHFKRPYGNGPLHSAKPEGFLDVVEQVSPGPYAELFARRARFGWDYPIGDESLGGKAA